MPSPAFLLKDLFTVSELQTMIRRLMTTGRITNVSGGGKSTGFEHLDFAQQMIELRAELNRLQGNATPRRVEQILRP